MGIVDDADMTSSGASLTGSTRVLTESYMVKTHTLELHPDGWYLKEAIDEKFFDPVMGLFTIPEFSDKESAGALVPRHSRNACTSINLSRVVALRSYKTYLDPPRLCYSPPTFPPHTPIGLPLQTSNTRTPPLAHPTPLPDPIAHLPPPTPTEPPVTDPDSPLSITPAPTTPPSPTPHIPNPPTLQSATPAPSSPTSAPLIPYLPPQSQSSLETAVAANSHQRGPAQGRSSSGLGEDHQAAAPVAGPGIPAAPVERQQFLQQILLNHSPSLAVPSGHVCTVV
ncbi:hypothetical protein Pcinc_004248 [Petrolisthes cinctipes]|uniref:Uncharacterized protein n=1 Tax=Petrolisthes cinctipes TaxID=88211 RepID=A0AAE1GHA8_PETCI|nr:hypothetical protein Pcinc_004248 [Petrolisthes cinctipes]